MKLVSQVVIQQRRIFALVALAGAVIFFAFDLVVDWLHEDGYGIWHLLIEFVVFVGVLVAFFLNFRDLRRLRSRLGRERRRNRHLSSTLVESLDDQMEEWKLTRSEKDVAWLIIKGYRFSEIAKARGVRENTARLQATSLYSKAGVHGRAEFVAEIIQPLLISVQDDSPSNLEEEKSDIGMDSS